MFYCRFNKFVVSSLSLVGIGMHAVDCCLRYLDPSSNGQRLDSSFLQRRSSSGLDFPEAIIVESEPHRGRTENTTY